MNPRKTDTVGFIVTRNIQAAYIFNSYDIDYYARGNRTVEEACIQGNVPIVNLFEELCELGDSDIGRDFASMDMIQLSTYILRNHHKFAEKKVTFIKHSLNRLLGFSGQHDPNLREIKKEFDELSLYLTVHMKHEEFVVFPHINKMAKSRGRKMNALQTIERPISSMKEDHEHEVLVLKRIGKLTNNYQAPSKSDYAFIITFDAMKELEEDLKIHMHLENNLLFPKAMSFAHAICKGGV